MKARYLLYSIVIFGIVPIVSACGDNFLKVTPKASTVESQYYKNAKEAYVGLVAAYDPMGWQGGIKGGEANFLTLVAASDEALGGGGSASDVPFFYRMNAYSVDPAHPPVLSFWEKDYAGVSRTNTILSVLQSDKKIQGLDEKTRKRYTAEASFLRAYYYFELVRLFGNVPLFTKPLKQDEIYKVKQATPKEVYAQIEKDLEAAVNEPNLPDMVPKSEGGRITKGAAHALLGKVYMWQKEWKKAVVQFKVVNGTPGGTSKFGYHLLKNFGNIFKVDNKFNAESILEITHNTSPTGSWGNLSTVEGGMASVEVGARSYSGPIYYSGWGGCPISPKLFKAIHHDPRYKATVANVDSLVKIGEASYIPGYEDTGHFIRKFAPLQEFKNTGAGSSSLTYPQDYIQIRLAGTYLLEAEALVKAGVNMKRAATLLNAVRARVGLLPETPTLQNIYHERFLELATEGHRWYTLIRTERAKKVLGPLGFKPKNKLLPIPLQELELNKNLKQNPGY
jgi:hypothetical protein